MKDGDDWEQVVDNDTRAVLRHHASINAFFHREAASLAVPALLTASLADEFAPLARFPETYAAMPADIPHGAMHLFPAGKHPALLSNAEEFATAAERFFSPSRRRMTGAPRAGGKQAPGVVAVKESP